MPFGLFIAVITTMTSFMDKLDLTCVQLARQGF